MNIQKTSRSGFTLIELLTVIAIIGILASILIPTVGGVKKKASMVSSSSNMKQVAISFATFSNAGNRTRVITDNGAWSVANNAQAADAKEWAKVLAYNAGLSDAGLYLISSDEALSAVATLPRSIGIRAGTAFTDSAEWTSLPAIAIGYVFAVNMSPNAPASSTPLLWTKGLSTAGEWAATSPWQGEGGHIAFMDGHTEFFNNLTAAENKLSPGSSSTATAATENILEAIKTTSTSASLPTI
jgi:prepilin-type N-terminal cleavage/methylation domain-containing protein